MPDMTDLPDAPDVPKSAEEIMQINRLKAEVEALQIQKKRLTTHEEEAAYWRSEEAMESD